MKQTQFTSLSPSSFGERKTLRFFLQREKKSFVAADYRNPFVSVPEIQLCDFLNLGAKHGNITELLKFIW
ncbi:hypothetical protein ACFX1R_042591 [Malus domestica]